MSYPDFNAECPCGHVMRDISGAMIPPGTFIQVRCDGCLTPVMIAHDGGSVSVTKLGGNGFVQTDIPIEASIPIITNESDYQCPVCGHTWMVEHDECPRCEITQLRRSLGVAHIGNIGNDRQWEKLGPEQIAAHGGAVTATGHGERGVSHILTALQPNNGKWWESLEPHQIEAIEKQVGTDPSAEVIRDAVTNICQSCNGAGWLFTIEGQTQCPVCFGTGKPPAPPPPGVTKQCRTCGGMGSVWVSGSWDAQEHGPCPSCEGSGQCPV